MNCRRFAILLSILFAPALGASLRADDAAPLVFIQKGELPIILSAPHGGNLPIPNTEERQRGERPTGGAGFVTGRDGNTEELAHRVAASIEAKFGKKPFVVIARSHRKYLDPNRPATLAYDDPDAKPTYDAYHQGLTDACKAVQEKFRRGLLLDIHGQGSAADTVFRGTQNGKTVKLLAERYGAGAIHGEASLFSLLKKGGWKVHPDPFEGKEQAGFNGGYIVQTYGSHQAIGVDAYQLEFGADYRKPSQHEKTAKVLTEAVSQYAKVYLDVMMP